MGSAVAFRQRARSSSSQTAKPNHSSTFHRAQVVFRPMIKSRGYDTSYNALARRARKREQQRLLEQLQQQQQQQRAAAGNGVAAAAAAADEADFGDGVGGGSAGLPPAARESRAVGGSRQERGLVSSFVLRGSVARRVAAYGLVQLCFTLATMLVGVAGYHCAAAALAWQVRARAVGHRRRRATVLRHVLEGAKNLPW